MMQAPRVFDANERINVALPAQMWNVIMETLRKTYPVVTYELLHPTIVELTMQLQLAEQQQQQQQQRQQQPLEPPATLAHLRGIDNTPS